MNTSQDEKAFSCIIGDMPFFSYLQSVNSRGTRKKKIYIETKMAEHIYMNDKRTNHTDGRFHEEEEARTKIQH